MYEVYYHNALAWCQTGTNGVHGVNITWHNIWYEWYAVYIFREMPNIPTTWCWHYSSILCENVLKMSCAPKLWYETHKCKRYTVQEQTGQRSSSDWNKWDLIIEINHNRKPYHPSSPIIIITLTYHFISPFKLGFESFYHGSSCSSLTWLHFTFSSVLKEIKCRRML